MFTYISTSVHIFSFPHFLTAPFLLPSWFQPCRGSPFVVTSPSFPSVRPATRDFARPSSLVTSMSTFVRVPPSNSYRQTHDPAHWPPPLEENESPTDSASRVEREKKAKAVSDEIDKMLAAEKQKRKKKKEAVRILLLGMCSSSLYPLVITLLKSASVHHGPSGQAESGKSTTLKNFQLQFAPRAFYSDAESWRTVVYLNLVRSVNCIMDIINAPPSTPFRPPTPAAPSGNSFGSPSHKPTRSVERPKTAEPAQPRAGPSRGYGPSFPMTYTNTSNTGTSGASQALSPELRRLKLSLAPLKSVEATLNKRLATIPRPKAIVPFPSSLSGEDAIQSIPIPSSFGKRSRSTRRRSLPSSMTHPQLLNVPSPNPQSSLRTVPSSGSSSGSAVSEVRPRSSTSSSSSSSEESRSSSIATAPSPPSRIAHHKSISHLIEFAVRVRSNSNWKRLARLPGDDRGQIVDPELDGVQQMRDLTSARAVIEACGEDMHLLWQNADVQSILARAGVLLQNEPGL